MLLWSTTEDESGQSPWEGQEASQAFTPSDGGDFQESCHTAELCGVM